MARMKKFEKKEDVNPPVPVNQWSPAPDMGKIQPPAPTEKVCANEQCKHKGGMHYGGTKNWCNTGGCNCQEFR